MITPLIILAYYDRPKMACNALESIRRQVGPWNLAIIDDGSREPIRPIAEDILRDYLDRVTFYYISDTPEQKLRQGGSRHGAYMNKAIDYLTGPDDPVVILCDDDALYEGYIDSLRLYYEQNPDIKWSYCHVSVFDPSKGPPVLGQRTPEHWLNRYSVPIAPSCQIDSSQVTYRASCISRHLEYPSPMTSELDAYMFTLLTQQYGLCPFNGITGQYKAVFFDTMGNRPIEERYAPRIK